MVTGGSAGVGRAAVRDLAERGGTSPCWPAAAGIEAAAARSAAAGRAAWRCCATSPTPMRSEAAADRVEAELGPIDVWVNVAFVGALRCFWDTDEETTGGSPT